MLKTIRRDEFKLMKRMLKDYYDHITIYNPDSMISRIFGLHKMIFDRKNKMTGKKIYFCIMNNVFNTNLKIDYRYDLKGSTLGRTYSVPEGQERDPTVALKDLDFLDNQEKFWVGEENRKRLMEIIRKDAKFFAKQEVIDYSLLVGIHDRNKHLDSVNSNDE